MRQSGHRSSSLRGSRCPLVHQVLGYLTEPLSEVVAPSPSEPSQQPAPEPVAEVVAAATPAEQTAELSADEIAALQNADTQLPAFAV